VSKINQEQLKDCWNQISWSFKSQTKREERESSTRTHNFYNG